VAKDLFCLRNIRLGWEIFIFLARHSTEITMMRGHYTLYRTRGEEPLQPLIESQDFMDNLIRSSLKEDSDAM
jgi:hypothetical protein